MITLRDYIEIHNLIARYCLSLDESKLDEFLDCWAADEGFVSYDAGSLGHMTTRNELTDFTRTYLSEDGLAQGKRHQAVNVFIEPVSATQVHVTHDLLLIDVRSSPPRVVLSGRYDASVVVKDGARWCFTQRSFRADPAA